MFFIKNNFPAWFRIQQKLSILPGLKKPGSTNSNPSENYVLRSATLLSGRSQVMEFTTTALQSMDLAVMSRFEARFRVNLLFEVEVPDIALIAMCAGIFLAFKLFANFDPESSSIVFFLLALP